MWPHRGKVAIAGIGHSNVERRFDGKTMGETLGAKAIQACKRAMADAGATPDQVDGMLCCPENGDGSGGPAGWWAPRPYFAPPCDSEDGRSFVTGKWLIKNRALPKIEFALDKPPALGEMTGMAAQVVAEGGQMPHHARGLHRGQPGRPVPPRWRGDHQRLRGGQ